MVNKNIELVTNKVTLQCVTEIIFIVSEIAKKQHTHNCQHKDY